ncbi:serine-aspartate repeat-containing protein F-like [Etheostoma cragini]|uniref:serine-aspartate repeat-containing protein F-like n=1 Tax=Etheostoma cragini TaxID=417921 RepID=UPI00155EF6FF|nr:serine-aspartate repeat-containing protein F-like [Etheostoma cragini]
MDIQEDNGDSKDLPLQAQVCSALPKKHSLWKRNKGFFIKKFESTKSKGESLSKEESDEFLSTRDKEPKLDRSDMNDKLKDTFNDSKSEGGSDSKDLDWKQGESDEEASTTRDNGPDSSNVNDELKDTFSLQEPDDDSKSEGDYIRKDLKSKQGGSDDDAESESESENEELNSQVVSDGSDNDSESPNVALGWEGWELNDLFVTDGSQTHAESGAGSTDNIDWKWWGLDGEFRGLCSFLQGESLNDVYKKQGESDEKMATTGDTKHQSDSSDVKMDE